MSTFTLILSIAIFLGCNIILVSAWGAEGHSMVADIASSMLTEKAKNTVNKYLSGSTMQSVASVADDYDHSTDGKWSEPMHYIDMLRNQTAYNAKINCPPLCVVGAIQNYTSWLG